MGSLVRLGMSAIVSGLLLGSAPAADALGEDHSSFPAKPPRAAAAAKKAAAKRSKKCKRGKVRRHGRCVKKPRPKSPGIAGPTGQPAPGAGTTGGGGPQAVTDGVGRLDRLVLSPAAATIAPRQPQNSSADYALLPSPPSASQAYSAQGLNPFGDPLGDVTAQAAFTVEPDGLCLGSVCSGGTPGTHTVRASAGSASGVASLTVAPYDDAYSMTCKGENYDLDGELGNGCEAAQPDPERTTQANAAFLGSFPCDDGLSAQNFGGTVVSDQRVHTAPAVPGFNNFSGSAPSWHKLTASGGMLCANDLKLVLTTSGGSPATCYKLVVIGTKNTYTLNVSGAGGTAIELGSGTYEDGATIWFAFERTCAAAREKVKYTVTGHL